MRAIIADDENLARQRLRQLLRAIPEIEIVGETAAGEETVGLVRALAPEILFLDIQMPGLDGFELLSELSVGSETETPKVIFTTAYDKYALQAFEVHAVDYLLKPFSQERLVSAIDQARRHLVPVGANHSSAASPAGTGYTKRIVFKSRGRIVFLPIESIRWIAAEQNYVRLCLKDESHLLRETMTKIEGRLDPEMFMRVHRGAIVNLQYVKEVRTQADGEYVVILVDDQKVPMSRTYRGRINGWLARK